MPGHETARQISDRLKLYQGWVPHIWRSFIAPDVGNYAHQSAGLPAGAPSIERFLLDGWETTNCGMGGKYKFSWSETGHFRSQIQDRQSVAIYKTRSTESSSRQTAR
jgi:hypothetical protein